MSTVPSRFYGDPSNCAEEMRKLRKAAEVQAERDRLHNGRRIRALVKKQMKGQHHGV